jgi:hypothetical protein
MRDTFRTLLACLLLTLSCWSVFGLRAQSVESASQESLASKIAEKAFLDRTKHKITYYSIKPLRHTEAEWHFLVQGTEEFARPGYHWFVTVDKTTGKTSVESGE